MSSGMIPTDDCGCKSEGRRKKRIMDPQSVARCNGLRYQLDDAPGITRQKRGKGFVYLDSHGRLVKKQEQLDHIRSLVIPPAWQNVWINPHADGHLQVTGIDARGRKQYRYHEKWRQVRDQGKYEKMLSFARALPRIRQQVMTDLSKEGLPREKVLATVVRLLEATCIRIGNEAYARDNESYGLTTMRNWHVSIKKCDINFRFTGKSGKDHNIVLKDCEVASIVKKCKARPGDLLFQYVDDNGVPRRVTSTDVNRYLRTISGQSITAKDFRTWWGTVLAALALKQFPPPTSAATARRHISTVVKQVAEHLGNTPTICRKCYIHPAVLEAFADGRTVGRVIGTKTDAHPPALVQMDLLPEERAVIRFLKQEWTRE